MLNWARAATNITNDEMIPRMLITMSEGRNMARGLARSASNAPLMISMTLNGLSGMIPGLGAREKACGAKPGPVVPKAEARPAYWPDPSRLATAGGISADACSALLAGGSPSDFWE